MERTYTVSAEVHDDGGHGSVLYIVFVHSCVVSSYSVISSSKIILTLALDLAIYIFQ